MDEEVKEHYIEAGRIAREARELAVDMVEPGAEALAIAEETESFIREEGAQPAFPVNVSIDEVAAHFTPKIADDTTLEAGQVVNVDVGVHVDGYIGDTAATVDLSGDHTDLVDASADALAAALDMVRPGANVGEIGAAIEDVIESAGFKPVRNLSGHGLEQYTQHSGDNIPNVATDTGRTLERGQAVAIEPFASTGTGKVSEGGQGNIYKLERTRARGRTERKLLNEAKNKFRSLPFASRWFENVPAPRVEMTLAKLARGGNVHAYDVLREEDGALVSQTEHTVLVLDEPVVTTRAD